MGDLARASDVMLESLGILKPAREVTVTENAAETVVLKSAAISGPYNPELSPLMREPADLTDSREFDSVIMVAPAQTGKTAALVLNVLAHRIVVNPVDVMVVEKSQADARDFSATRFDRLVQDSPIIQSHMLSGRGEDNRFDKKTKAGSIIRFGHPSKNALAGKPIPVLLMTDYDRFQDNVGGEGNVFDQASQRTKSYMSKGISIAESSPARPVIDPKWEQPEGSHEAPPTSGILGLYNNGDRRMVYSQCPHCKDYFSPDPNPDLSMWVPAEGSIEERAEKCGLVCSSCGSIIGTEHERDFKSKGIWVKEGQTVDSDGQIHGEGKKSKRASFWLSGWFASFNTWQNLALSYIRAKESYELSGDENSLQNCANQMFAAPYIEQARRSERAGFESIKERAIDLERFHVPEGVRTIITTVDVQGGKKARFEVCVLGFGVDNRMYPMDRFAITESKRGGRVDPAVYIEDWDLITERLDSTYKLGGDKELMVHQLGIDCGGEDGVYEKALDWYRSLSHSQKAKANLVKGDALTYQASKKAPKVRKTFPDSTKAKSKKVTSTGDVPVILVNTHRVKDDVYNFVNRENDGFGYVSFPKYWEDHHYEELLNAEYKDEKGWNQIKGKRNETFDLFGYAIALWNHIGGVKIDWSYPPIWAADMEKNTNVITKGVRQKVKSKRSYRRIHS